MNRQTFSSVTTGDDDGHYFATALRIVDVLDQEKRLPPHLLGQILWVGDMKPGNHSEVTVYADGFEEIEMICWHDGRLHVMHGPNYSIVAGIPGEPGKAKREDRSMVVSTADHNSSPSKTAMEALQGVLADRTKSNELRIDALWKLRAMTNDHVAIKSCSGFPRTPMRTPPEFDPTKSFITALHNGPDALRAEAARALRMRTVDTQPAIKGLIHRARNDTHAKVRMEAALTLGHLKAKDAAGDLLGSLNDPDDAARIAKVMAIRMINEWELAPAFINASDERTREGTLIALRDVHTKGGIEALVFAVRSCPYSAIRVKAIEMLAKAAIEVKFVDTAFLQTGISFDDPRSKALDLPMWFVARSNSRQWNLIEETLLAATQDEESAVRTAAAVGLSFVRSNKVANAP